MFTDWKQRGSRGKAVRDDVSSSADSSKISTNMMYSIIEMLKIKQTRDTTFKNCLRIWKKFNNFLIKLDSLPEKWEERAMIFAANLVNEGMQSSTV